jgi:acyl-CoA reductase-like NAD-dependent aldehyde dehydrogenase
MTSPFAPLLAASIDGRTHNIYYRQHELEALHHALLAHASELKTAIAADTDHTPAEIAVEIHLTLQSLKASYETLQPTKSLADEYLIASGKDAPENRVPAGIAYIEPCAHTPLFSVVAPLSAAIGAGNCVVVLVSRRSKPVPQTSLTTRP